MSTRHQCYISTLIGALIVFVGQVLGATTVNVGEENAKINGNTVKQSPSKPIFSSSSLTENNYGFVLAPKFNENKDSLITSSSDFLLFLNRPELNLWIQYETPWTVLSDLDFRTTRLNSQGNQPCLALAANEDMPTEYQLYHQPMPLETMISDSKFLDTQNMAGEGAVVSPPFVPRTSGEGDSSHTTFDVVGDAEPISSLPVIPAPVAILLAGLSAALITWSRHRRAM